MPDLTAAVRSQTSQEELPRPEKNTNAEFAPATAQQLQQTPQSLSRPPAFTGRFKGVALDEAQKQILLRCCVGSKVTYERGTKGKYWKSVSIQFELAAKRPYTAYSCERAIQKLIEGRRRYLEDRSRAGAEYELSTDFLVVDGELGALVDAVIPIQDQYELSQKEPTPQRALQSTPQIPQTPNADAVTTEGDSVPAPDIAWNKLKARQIFNSLLGPIIDRLTTDRCAAQPKIPNHREYVERTMQKQLQEMSSIDVGTMEEVHNMIDEVLRVLRGE